MFFAYVAAIAPIALGQVTVLVVEDNAAQTPIKEAEVTVIKGKDISDPVFTGPDGSVVLEQSRAYTADHDLRVKKKPFDTYDEPWPADIEPEGQIDVRLKLTRKSCRYTVQRIVRETLPDGRVVCRGVVETAYRDCPPAGKMNYLMPAMQPPPGYKYEFAYATRRWDPERQAYAYRPWWNIVPACPSASDENPAPCACR